MESCGCQMQGVVLRILFFFNDTATAEIYPLSLHDALPIWARNIPRPGSRSRCSRSSRIFPPKIAVLDRKSTRLNSSHLTISYAVFCLKKKTRNYDFAATEVATALWAAHQEGPQAL